MSEFERTFSQRHRTKAVWFALIVVLSTAAGLFVFWRAPGLNLDAQDQLMRARGELPLPDDILIVAIDDASIARLGRFPWKRSLTARVVDRIAPNQPRAIAIDVLFPEPTEEPEDEALATAIKRAGNVVIGEQLIQNRESATPGGSEWLRSIPGIENAAAGIGHVNVETERDGAAREMLLRMADDQGFPRWALAVETIRVGDYLNSGDISETSRAVLIGKKTIPFTNAGKTLQFVKKDAESRFSTIQPQRMTIDYVGAAGRFSSQMVSFADVLEGKINPERFRGKYVLIGATAATLGDRIATPFVHSEDAEGEQHGELIPGVEILANEINTILRERFYQNASDWSVALLTALVAFSVIVVTGFAEGRFEAAKQLGGLAAILLMIVLVAYFAFTRAYFVLPVVPMLASFFAATPLALFRRSFAASSDLDLRIAELVAAEKRLLTSSKDASEKAGNPHLSAQSASRIDRAGESFLPRGLEWKAETLGHLSRDLISRSLFIDRALRSLDEGLIIAETNGQITFANERATQILGVSERALIGSDLFERLTEAGDGAEISKSLAEKTLTELLDDHQTIEREIVIGEKSPRYYILRLSAVVAAENDSREALGIVAALSDVSHHRELEKTQNEVIALVTHELRTPLTAIQGLSELLAEHEIDPDSQANMLATINSEAKRLARMVNEYLDITRLESGVQKTYFAPVGLHQLLEQTMILLEPLAVRRQIRFVRRFDDVRANISADAELLGRAITNVIANAIKYSPDGTEITIATRQSGESVEIRVTDQGFGISAEHLPRIFDKFYRVPQRKLTADVAGTGLGLALTYEIIELHGGRIDVLSDLNKGSEFTIVLPMRPV